MTHRQLVALLVSLGFALLDCGAPELPEVPLVRVDPIYSRCHPIIQERGAWVLIEFTISKTGSVVAPKILDSSQPDVFDRSALDSIVKWKYTPIRRNGVPVPRAGVQVRLDFSPGDVECGTHPSQPAEQVES